MPPKNPNLEAEVIPILQSESAKTASELESENSISADDRRASKKSKSAPNLDAEAIPILQSESTKTTSELESENSISADDRRASKKSKSTDLGHERWRDSASLEATTKSEGTVEENSSGRERLKRHRVEVAGRVWIPEMWGQEDFLKDWIDCTVFDAALRNSGIMSARASLVEEGRRANSTRFRIDNFC